MGSNVFTDNPAALAVYNQFPHKGEWCQLFYNSSGFYEAWVDTIAASAKTSSDIEKFVNSIHPNVKLIGLALQAKRFKNYYIIAFEVRS